MVKNEHCRASKLKVMFEIKKSKIHGNGCFASEPIKKGETIGAAFVKINDTGNCDADYQRTKLGQFVNHSDKPNLKIKKEGSEILFVAKNTIDADEELFANYEEFGWEGKKILK